MSNLVESAPLVTKSVGKSQAFRNASWISLALIAVLVLVFFVSTQSRLDESSLKSSTLISSDINPLQNRNGEERLSEELSKGWGLASEESLSEDDFDHEIKHELEDRDQSSSAGDIIQQIAKLKLGGSASQKELQDAEKPLQGTSLSILREMLKDLKHPSVFEATEEKTLSAALNAPAAAETSQKVLKPKIISIQPSARRNAFPKASASGQAVTKLPGIIKSSWGGVSKAASVGSSNAKHVPGVKESTWPFAPGSFHHHPVPAIPGVNEDSWWVFEPGRSWRADRRRQSTLADNGCVAGPRGQLICPTGSLEKGMGTAMGLSDLTAAAPSDLPTFADTGILHDAESQRLDAVAAAFGSSFKGVAGARLQQLAMQSLETVDGQCSTFLDCFDQRASELVPHHTRPVVAADWDRHVMHPSQSASLEELAREATDKTRDTVGHFDQRTGVLGGEGYTGMLSRPSVRSPSGQVWDVPAGRITDREESNLRSMYARRRRAAAGMARSALSSASGAVTRPARTPMLASFFEDDIADSRRFGKHLPASVLEGAWGHFEATHDKGSPRQNRGPVILHPCRAPGLNNGSGNGCDRVGEPVGAAIPRVSMGLTWGDRPDATPNATEIAAGEPTVCERGVNCGESGGEGWDPLFLSPQLNNYKNKAGQVANGFSMDDIKFKASKIRPEKEAYKALWTPFMYGPARPDQPGVSWDVDERFFAVAPRSHAAATAHRALRSQARMAQLAEAEEEQAAAEGEAAAEANMEPTNDASGEAKEDEEAEQATETEAAGGEDGETQGAAKKGGAGWKDEFVLPQPASALLNGPEPDEGDGRLRRAGVNTDSSWLPYKHEQVWGYDGRPRLAAEGREEPPTWAHRVAAGRHLPPPEEPVAGSMEDEPVADGTAHPLAEAAEAAAQAAEEPAWVTEGHSAATVRWGCEDGMCGPAGLADAEDGVGLPTAGGAVPRERWNSVDRLEHSDGRRGVSNLVSDLGLAEAYGSLASALNAAAGGGFGDRTVPMGGVPTAATASTPEGEEKQEEEAAAAGEEEEAAGEVPAAEGEEAAAAVDGSADSAETAGGDAAEAAVGGPAAQLARGRLTMQREALAAARARAARADAEERALGGLLGRGWQQAAAVAN